MILNQNDTARLQVFTEARKHGIYIIPGMLIVEYGDQNVGWVGGKNLDILFSCNTRTGFSDRNSGPKLCAVSIANNGRICYWFSMPSEKSQPVDKRK